jgi:Rod binding domain-containing protein
MEAINTNQAMLAYQNSKAVPKAPMIPEGASMAQMRKVAEDFEAFFLSQALQPMFANIEAEGPFGGGPGDDIWKSMQVDEFGKVIAKSGGIGIADSIMKQMLQAQESRSLDPMQQ